MILTLVCKMCQRWLEKWVWLSYFCVSLSILLVLYLNLHRDRTLLIQILLQKHRLHSLNTSTHFWCSSFYNSSYRHLKETKQFIGPCVFPLLSFPYLRKAYLSRLCVTSSSHSNYHKLYCLRGKQILLKVKLHVINSG